MKRKVWAIALIAIMMLVVAACGGKDEAVPTSSITPNPESTAASAPTATPAESPASTPEATPASSVTATATATATAESTPTATPVSSATTAPSATPIVKAEKAVKVTAAPSSKPTATPVSTPAGPRKINYLGVEYTIPGKESKIVITGAMEALEDALVLNVKPAGALTVGGKFPSMFAGIMGGVQPIGEKSQPNLESILQLEPDIILSSAKFPAETGERLNKIATTIPVSFRSTDWEANLLLLGELTGKQEQAKKVLQTYRSDLKSFKAKIGPVFKDKKVMVIRIRTGKLFLYPQDVFFNSSIYEELGATVPDEVKQAKVQQLVSLEQFTVINPDYLFIQFSEEENKDTPAAYEDLKNDPIWKSINAVKNGNVFLNVVDPIAQGGTAYSKTEFLKAIQNVNFNPVK